MNKFRVTRVIEEEMFVEARDADDAVNKANWNNVTGLSEWLEINTMSTKAERCGK
jgi:hypothetical protein